MLLLLLCGCAHTWSPKQVPEISLEIASPLDGQYSVSLINNQPNTTPQLFAGIGGHTHYANYNEWTQFYIDTFSKELVKRGVKVGADSPNQIKIALSRFAFFQGFWVLRVNMEIRLESGDGKWQKVLEETDTSGWSMGRAFGSVMYHSMEKLLKDQAVLEMMRVKPVASGSVQAAPDSTQEAQ
jgi:hypothetical protein